MLLLTWCIFRHGKNRFLHDILPISYLFIYDPGFRINQSVMFLVFQNFSLKIKLFWLLHRSTVAPPFSYTLRPFETLLFSWLPMIWHKISFFSLLSKTWKLEKKSCPMTEIQNCTLWFDRKTVFVEFCQLEVLEWDFISIWKPNPCMDSLEK